MFAILTVKQMSAKRIGCGTCIEYEPAIRIQRWMPNA